MVSYLRASIPSLGIQIRGSENHVLLGNLKLPSLAIRKQRKRAPKKRQKSAKKRALLCVLINSYETTTVSRTGPMHCRAELWRGIPYSFIPSKVGLTGLELGDEVQFNGNLRNQGRGETLILETLNSNI